MSYERHEQLVYIREVVSFCSKDYYIGIRFCFRHCILDIKACSGFHNGAKGQGKKREPKFERGIRVEF